MNGEQSGSKQKRFKGSFALLLALLGGTLAVLCHEGFRPYEVFWSNDFPLGALMESSAKLPASFFGSWTDFWWLGGPNDAFSPILSNIMMAILSPQYHFKFYAPLSMLFLGFGAWFFFRQLRFAPMVCVVGGLGAGLNMHFLSNACWGLGVWNVCVGMIFIAMGILVSTEIRPLWVKGLLAGFSTGMAVMEGSDVGAILSIYVGVFLAFLFLFPANQEELVERVGKITLVGALVAVAAALICVFFQLVGFSAGMELIMSWEGWSFLAVYVVILPASLFLTDKKWLWLVERAVKTVLAGGLVVVAAGLISLSTIFTLVQTQIKGTSGSDQSAAAKEARWAFNTQWSIPKLETLRVIIPGLFGYRMQEYTTPTEKPLSLITGRFGYPMLQTNKAGVYWGKIAEDPHVADLESGDPQVRTNAAASLGLPPPIQDLMAGNDVAARQAIIDQVKGQVQRRHTGNGEYAGVLVCLLAVFGVASAGRKAGSPFSTPERRVVWFWGCAALFSLLAAWGRHGFLYRLIYHLPYLSSIRSPMKFMHPLNISLMILCGYGLEALYRGCLAQPANRTGSFVDDMLKWWKKASGFDTRWVVGSAIVLVAGLAGYFVVRASKVDLINYLQHNGFDAALSPQIAGFCIGEVGLFVVFLALSAGVVICILSGVWAGQRAAWAWVFLSVVMICDLSRADVPWIRYYNYKQKLSMNPVVDILRPHPWDHRVVSRLSPMGPYDIGPDANFGGLCHWWLENDYPVNDIESLEIDQAPRMPTLDSSYLNNFLVRSGSDLSPATRLWRLTNTRYVFADARLEPVLNQLSEPKNSFREVLRVSMGFKPGITVPEDGGDWTVQPDPNGPLALIEYTRALPRAKLYANWQTMDDPAALRTLGSAEFDPEKTVLVAKDTPVSQTPANPNADPGTVNITQYQSKVLILQADAKTPAVLLLNDHTGDFWNVRVDQQPGTMLRCNYIMQGLFLPAGRHTIELRFQPPQKKLYISLTAFALAILLGGYATVNHLFRKPPADNPPPPTPKTP